MKQESINFISRALECKTIGKDIKTKVKFYSHPYSCPPLLDVAGKSMEINFTRTSICVNKLCSQRGVQAVGLKDLSLFDLEEIVQLNLKYLKVDFALNYFIIFIAFPLFSNYQIDINVIMPQYNFRLLFCMTV